MKQLGSQTLGSQTYRVYELEKDEVLDTVDLGMISNNDIQGFAKTVFMQMDDIRYLKYDITGRISIRMLLDGTIGRKRLLDVLRAAAAAMAQVEGYMLNPESILTGLDDMFVNISKNEVTLICLPILSGQRERATLAQIVKKIMMSAQFDPREDCAYVAQILSYLNLNENFTPEAFLKFLNTLNSEKKTTPLAAPAPQPKAEPVAAAVGAVREPVRTGAPAAPAGIGRSPLGAVEIPREKPPAKRESAPPAREEKKMSLYYLLQHYNKENAAVYKAQRAAKREKSEKQPPRTEKPHTEKNPPAQPVNYAIPGMQPPLRPAERLAAQTPKAEAAPPTPVTPKAPPQRPVVPPVDLAAQETEYFGGSEETVLLDDLSAGCAQPVLRRCSTQERIPITAPTFRIGRDREFNDYVVLDNKFIGHTHCHIVTHNGAYFIVDDNSKNHTSVDGKTITPGEEIELHPGQIIRMANEDFEFRLN